MKKVYSGIAAVGFLVSGMAWAQSAQQIAATKSLTAPAQQVIARLGQLNRIPDGEWRVHPGDLPHGESLNLDDSTWPIAKPGSDYSDDAVWFRQWIEIPKSLHGYDLTGANVWFQFQARTTGREAVTEIVYVNGARIALGESLERLELVHGAKPGERILVAVKLLGTSLNKRYQSTLLAVDFAPGRPSPQELDEEFLSAAILIPSISTQSAADLATLEKAIGQVDIAALDAGDQQKFDDSLKASQASLQAAAAPAATGAPCISPATRTSMPHGCGRGAKPSMSSSAPSLPRCN